MNIDRIVILTPRILLNHQIVDDRYSSYIKDKNYKFIHFSDIKGGVQKENTIQRLSQTTERTIMTCCYQSGNKLLECIVNNNFRFDLIIFDEAHFITSWADVNNISQFLESKDICSYRLFGSATPTEEIELTPLIYGKVTEKVRVYELINQKILCNIETIVKQLDEKKTMYHNLKNLVVEAMVRHNKKKGIIFVNDCKNAENLYSLLKKQDKINVYIYVSKDVSVETASDKDINEFEKDKTPCVIICVGKISYGYDNDFIDFVCLGDPRQSDIDIRQIIGRGLRWNHSTYPNKVLHLLIPLYRDDFGNCAKNDHLKKYLDYIIGECGKDIIFKSDGRATIKSGMKTTTDGKDYGGDDISSEILNEYCMNLFDYNITKRNAEKIIVDNWLTDKITISRLSDINKFNPTEEYKNKILDRE